MGGALQQIFRQLGMVPMEPVTDGRPNMEHYLPRETDGGVSYIVVAE
jgi:hypothetical protein